MTTGEGRSARRVPVFFYGSFINRGVLEESGVVPENIERARLFGWDIRIEPLATLIPSDRGTVYGIVVSCSHAELERLYGQDWVGTYLPEPVLVEVEGGKLVPSLTYIKWDYRASPARRDYIERIVGPARELGFPPWYVERLESFASSP